MDIWQFVYDSAAFWIWLFFTIALVRWIMRGFEMNMPGDEESEGNNDYNQ